MLASIRAMAALRLGLHARRCRGLCAHALTARDAAARAAANIAEAEVAAVVAISDPDEGAPLGSQKHLLNAVTNALAPNGTEVVALPEEDVANLEGLYAALMQPLPEEATREERINAMATTDTSEAGFFRRRERSLETLSHWVRCLGVQGKLAEAHAAFDQIEASSACIADQWFFRSASFRQPSALLSAERSGFLPTERLSALRPVMLFSRRSVYDIVDLLSPDGIRSRMDSYSSRLWASGRTRMCFRHSWMRAAARATLRQQRQCSSGCIGRAWCQTPLCTRHSWALTLRQVAILMR